jgi:hypothetical protein
MNLSSRFIAWIGGTLLFVGLLLFITFYAVNSSGVLSSQYFNTAIHEIVNASTFSGGNSLLGGNSSSQNMTNFLGSFNSNCNLLCLVQAPSSLPISQSSFGFYQLISEILAAVGAVLMFLSYTGGDKLFAIGKTSLSAAIISFVSTYVPIAYLLPYLASSFNVHGFSIVIPVSVTAPFTNVVLSLDTIFMIAGVVLIVVGRIVFRKKTQAPQSGQKITEL